MDNFYKNLPKNVDPKQYNFDDPISMDHQEFENCLK
jgi:hypothetical protein